MKTGFPEEDRYIGEVNAKLKLAGESVWQRYPLPTQHPSFKSSSVAAERMLQELEGFQTYLVMRDVCLRKVREAVLKTGKTLVVPLRHGSGVAQIPGSAMADGVLRIDPLPKGSTAFTGTVDVVVVACHAYDAKERRFYSFELEQTSAVLDELHQGLVTGWHLPVTVPVVCVAADEQQVSDWPDYARGLVSAVAVFTQTRTLFLGSGERSGGEAAN